MDYDVNPAFSAWHVAKDNELKERALQILIERMEKFARAICWQRIPEYQADFDPLINGIVWRAIRKADSFKRRSKFSTWFCRIVINECNKFLRSRKESREVELEEEMPTKLEAIDARLDLLAMLDSLEGEDHQLLRLQMEGLDFQETGERLEISRNAALVRWNRLKGRLRDAFC
jgi:RNA polymerase sigma-70 factor (ECF subfamily)